MTVQHLAADQLDDALSDLTDILHATVLDGASVGFIHPFSKAEAAAFWTDTVFKAVEQDKTALFVARHQGRIAGTVQLGVDLPPNQPHRADIAKMLVHPNARRQGLGRQLMETAIAHARRLGKTLLVLDTRSGDPAGHLYAQLGFDVAGSIPGYCLNPADLTPEATTYMYMSLT